MQGLDTNSTLKNLIYMYKGSELCQNETSEFKICRATPAGLADPTTCQNKANNFLGCYNQVVKNSRANCTREYANAYACLEQNINTPDDDGSGACSASLRKFANCS